MKVVAAMSGGVDSSVTAALLVEQGHEVVGVHMKLHDQSPTAVPGTCCGLERSSIPTRKILTTLLMAYAWLIASIPCGRVGMFTSGILPSLRLPPASSWLWKWQPSTWPLGTVGSLCY